MSTSTTRTLKVFPDSKNHTCNLLKASFEDMREDLKLGNTYCNGVFHFIAETVPLVFGSQFLNTKYTEDCSDREVNVVRCQCGLEKPTQPEGRNYCNGIKRTDGSHCPVHVERKKAEHVQSVIEQCTAGGRKPDLSFENFKRELQPKAYETCRKWEYKGRLILCGPPGIGKSYLAKSMHRDLLIRGVESIYFDIIELLELFRDMENYSSKSKRESAKQQFERLLSSVVFIDDLGSERVNTSELFVERFRYILDEKPDGLVITTNFNRTTITESYGPKIASRLYHNATVLVFQGEDYRSRNMKAIKPGK